MLSRRIDRSLTSLAMTLLIAGLFCSCSRLKVESNPPGAHVLWSRDGVEPFQSWPPSSWEIASTRTNSQTPFRTYGVFSDTVFITVEKDGFRRPLPKPVELYALRRETLKFDLSELPESVATRMRAEGKLLYEGNWVDPEQAGVVEYNGVVMKKDVAFRLEQIAKGLVEYKGAWYSKEEAAAKLQADMTAAGLVAFKGRWITPEEQQAEERIDNEVAEIKAGKTYPDLVAPKVLGGSPTTEAQVQLYNSSGQKVVFHFSGPISKSYELEPYRSTGVRVEDRILLVPGRYEISVVPTGKDASGQDLTALLGKPDRTGGVALSTKKLWGSWPMAGRTQYSFNYTGTEGDLQETLSNFDAPPPKVDIDVPTIEIPEFKLPEQQAPPGGPGQWRRPEGGGAPGGAPGAAPGGANGTRPEGGQRRRRPDGAAGGQQPGAQPGQAGQPGQAAPGEGGGQRRRRPAGTGEQGGQPQAPAQPTPQATPAGEEKKAD